MRHRQFIISIVWLLALTPTAQAGSDMILCSCVPPNSGPAVADSNGNIFSTTDQSIFELVHPLSGAQWRTATVANFASCAAAPGCADNQYALVTDNKDDVFGTASVAGEFIVFAANATFGMHPIYQGPGPYTPGLAIDHFGNLYGVVLSGGLGYGGVFALSATTSGWQFELIWEFRSNNAHIVPVPPIYEAGNLYVETPGDIIRLRNVNGRWMGTILAKNPGPVSWQLGYDGALYMLTSSNLIVRLSPQTRKALWQSTVLVPNAAAYRKLQPRPIALDFANNVYARFGYTVQYSSPPGGGTPWQRQNFLCQDCFLTSGPDGNICGLTYSFYQAFEYDLRQIAP